MPSLKARVDAVEGNVDMMIKKFLLILGELKALKYIGVGLLFPVYVLLMAELVKLFGGVR